MSSSRFAASVSWMGRVLSHLWWVINTSRKLLLNLLFFSALALVVAALTRGAPAPLSDKTTLVLQLRGPLVEQQADTPRGVALAQLGGKGAQATQLRDVLTALDTAAQDPKITSAVLLLDEFQGAGLPALREVAAALQRFKKTGKPVWAWGMGLDQRQYYLAAHASEAWLHPMGMVFVQGLGGYRNYYREALDRLGITVNLIRVGTFKSAGEVYVANQPSPASQEASSLLYNAMWASYTRGVEVARKLPEGSVMALINELPQRLNAVNGNAAQLALQSKLIDGLLTRDEMRQRLIERGAPSKDGKTFRQIGMDDYLARPNLSPRADAAVGVVVAEGTIVDGSAPAGTVGGVSTAELVRKARLDPAIKALVLRVNSPGGSPLGSELVRRELELTRAAGKPVVVSMGDVAASGGYWVSMAADEVVADEATITGSIGVFALLPRADQALEKVGISTGGVTTTWLASVADPRRPLDPRFTELLQSHLNHIYADFTGKAAKARKTTPEAIDAVAQGRVWTGAQAKERGLVDTLGGLREAVATAAKRAGLKQPRTLYIEPERSRMERLISFINGSALVQGLVQGVGASMAAEVGISAPGALGMAAGVARLPQAQQAQRELTLLLQSADGHNPFATLAHCMCGVE